MASRTTRQFTVSFPPELAEQVESTARAENRTLSELFREAFRSYEAQRVEKILKRAQKRFAANNPAGHTEADVPRLVKQHRAEKRAKRE
ncbi:MAG: ribbon-helix-helix domain-containing protein [Bryobacteraceae bacterium]